MPTNNFKLFDQNKANLPSDTEYANATQRLNGVQTGVASSQLNNKFAYQVSLVAYAIAQIMNQNGLDASDTLAVSAFVGNLGDSLLQKVADRASSAEAAAGVLANKYISPATLKAAALLLSGGVMTGTLDMNNNQIINLPTPISNSEPATKEYVDGMPKKVLSERINLLRTSSTLTRSVSKNLSKEIDLHDIDALGIKLTFNTNFTVTNKSSSDNYYFIKLGNIEIYSSDVVYEGSTTTLAKANDSIFVFLPFLFINTRGALFGIPYFDSSISKIRVNYLSSSLLSLSDTFSIYSQDNSIIKVNLDADIYKIYF